LKVCTRCGTQNPDHKNYCENCNSVLPAIPASAQSPKTPDVVLERYNQLREAADLVMNGEWTIDEYAEFLENIAQVLAQKEQEIRDIEIPEEAYEDFEDELSVGFEGITLYNEGIAHMMLFLDDQDPAHIEYGLELVYQGNENINEAMKINRINRRKLEEMYVDTSTMM